MAVSNPTDASDQNWGLFKIVPREGKKPDKIPMDLQTGDERAQWDRAFVYPFEAVKAKLNGGSILIGYRSVETSQYVGLDIDNCIGEDEKVADWAKDIIGDYKGPMGVTPSGTGLRIMQLRRPGDEEQSIHEAGGVGFFGNSRKVFTVPLDALAGEVTRDEGLVQRLLTRRDEAAQARRAEVLSQEDLQAKQKSDWGIWERHWLAKLDPEDQEAAIWEMLDCLPFTYLDEYRDWFLVTVALHDLASRVRWDVVTLWDDWSARAHNSFSAAIGQGNKYNRDGNQKTWDSISNDLRKTIHSLIYEAEVHGFDAKPWKDMARRKPDRRALDLLAAAMGKPGEVSDDDETSGWGDFFQPASTLPEPTPVKFIIDQFLPVAGGVLNGADGIAKSTFALFVAIHVALGKDLTPQRKVRTPGRVVIVSKEDDTNLMHLRLNDLLNDNGFTKAERQRAKSMISIRDLKDLPMAETKLIQQTRESGMTQAPFTEALIGHLKAVKPSLVVLDPFVAFGVSEAAVNDNEAAVMFAANQIAEQVGAGVLLIHHVSQEAGRNKTDDQYAGRGGSALSGQSRIVLSMASQRDPAQREKLGVPPEITDEEIIGERIASINVAKITAQARPRQRLFVRRAPHGFGMTLFEGMAPETAQTPEQSRDQRQARMEKIVLWVHVRNGEGFHPSRTAVRSDGGLQKSVDLRKTALDDLILTMINSGYLIEGPPDPGKSGRGLRVGTPLPHLGDEG